MLLKKTIRDELIDDFYKKEFVNLNNLIDNDIKNKTARLAFIDNSFISLISEQLKVDQTKSTDSESIK